MESTIISPQQSHCTEETAPDLQPWTTPALLRLSSVDNTNKNSSPLEFVTGSIAYGSSTGLS